MAQLEKKYSVASTDDPWCTSENPRVIEFEEILNAQKVASSGTIKTPCFLARISQLLDMQIYLKLESMQQTGSFKERGARYCMMMLSEDEKKRGVVAASLGNHSQGVSYHGMLLDIPVTVVMPTTAPIMKIQKCINYKANVVVSGDNMGEAKLLARKIAKEQGKVFINGYDHPHVIAGQGVIGLEILDQVDNVDAVIIPIGGGGLFAGVTVAIKKLSPKTEIIGVEAENCPGFTEALKHGKPTVIVVKATIADGLAVPKVGYNAFATVKDKLDHVITVSEELLNVSMLHMIENEKLVVEGAGASPLAALLTGKLGHLKGKKVVLVISGGNIDTTMLGRVLERGLGVIGRYIKFSVYVSDRPGGIADLTRDIAQFGVTVKHIFCERAWIHNDDFSVKVRLLCETRDIDNAVALRNFILEKYPKNEFRDFPNVCTARKLWKLKTQGPQKK